MNRFGDLVRSTREEKGLLLRHLAAELDVDTALISKIERGDKSAKRDQVLAISQVLNLDIAELTTLWLADQIYLMIKDEDMALKALTVAQLEIEKNLNN